MKNFKEIISQSILEDEKKYLKNNWFLIGAKSEFRNKNDFKTFQIFNTPIIVYNFNGIIKAFTNICPHRGSKIKLEKTGNGVFNCVYHGWSFNIEGKVVSAPFKKEAFNNLGIENKSLEKWNIDFCNNLIFISHLTNKIPLKNYLGKSFNLLDNLTRKCENQVFSKEYIWNCNWKLSIENAIDEYHAPILHKNTFKKTLNLNPHYSLSKKVLAISLPLNEKYLLSFKKNELFEEKDILDNYYHFLFFPNTTFASTMGIFNFLQTYFPISHEQTLVTTTIFIDKIKKSNNNVRILDVIKNMAIAFNNEVFQEDKSISEDLHKNILNGYFYSNFGKFETRVKEFRSLL